MAILTITVDDAQVARVRAAYQVASNALLRTAIIADIKQRVIDFEVEAAYAQSGASIQTAQAAAIQAGLTAKANAETVSIT